MARFAGLDIDRNFLRMAIFEGTAKKFSLVDYIEEEVSAETDEERGELVAGVLTDVVSRKENNGIEVVTCLNARSTILREIGVPYTKDETIAKTVKFEAESYLHGVSIEDVVVDYLRLQDGADGARLILCAAPKDKLGSHLESLKSGAIDPSAVELDVTAMATSFAATPLYSGTQNVLLVEIEEEYSRMVFLEKDQIAKVRSVWNQVGGFGSSDAILKQTRETESTPDFLRNEPAASSDGGVASAVVESPEKKSVVEEEVEDRFRDIERALIDMEQLEESGGGGDLPIAVISDDEYERLSLSSNQGELQTDALFEEVDSLLAEDGSEPHSDEIPIVMELDEDSESAQSAGEDVPLVISDEDDSSDEEEAPAFTVPAVYEGHELVNHDPLERLFSEIERTFASYVIGNPIDLVVISGRCAAKLNAVERMIDRFELDVVALDLGDSFDVKWQGDKSTLSSTGAVACGLALRALGKGFTAFDLRQEEYKYERRFAKLIPALSLCAMLAAGALFLGSFQAFIDTNRLQNEIDSLRANQKSHFLTFFQESRFVDEEDTVNVLAKAKTKLKRLGKGAGKRGKSALKIKQFLNPIEIMSDVANCVKTLQRGKDSFAIEWSAFNLKTTIEKSGRGSQVKMVLANNDQLLKIEEALGNSQLFTINGTDLTSKSLKDGRIEVTVNLRLKQSVIDARGK